MIPSFGSMLASRLKDLKWSHREFARKIGSSHGFIDFIINGRSGGPDEAEVVVWAAVLGIEGEARERFLLAAGWSRTARRVKEYVWRSAPALFDRDVVGLPPLPRRVATRGSPYRSKPEH